MPLPSDLKNIDENPFATANLHEIIVRTLRRNPTTVAAVTTLMTTTTPALPTAAMRAAVATKVPAVLTMTIPPTTATMNEDPSEAGAATAAEDEAEAAAEVDEDVSVIVAAWKEEDDIVVVLPVATDETEARSDSSPRRTLGLVHPSPKEAIDEREPVTILPEEDLNEAKDAPWTKVVVPMAAVPSAPPVQVDPAKQHLH